MLQEDVSTYLLGLSNVCVGKMQNSEGKLHIEITTEKKKQICPCCGRETSYVHDYRLQVIKGLRIRREEVCLLLKKRRYVCKNCGKRFMEKYDFLPRYAHCTRDVYASIITSFNEKRTVKDIAEEHNVSPATVERLLDKVCVGNKPTLPVAMGIDEFKGNTNGEKYQVILTDIQQRQVINILPTRFKSDLTGYFREYSLEERKKVRVLVTDMWENYRRLSWLFPNAVIVVDRYHWIRQVNWALDKVRKRAQKTLPPWVRRYVKKLRHLLHKPYADLKTEEKITLRNILETNTDLYNAWQLKEIFYEFKDESTYDSARKKMLNFLLIAEEINLPEFKDCITALHNWTEPILNSFRYRYTNAFTEGCNNTIKVIKRISYGYRRFDRFRKRILLQFAS